MGISRTTYYKWIKLEEYIAEVDRCGQELLSSTRRLVSACGPGAVKGLKLLAETAKSEKVRLEAYSKLLDKTVSNATKIEVTDGRDDKDSVSNDVLNEEINDIDNSDNDGDKDE